MLRNCNFRFLSSIAARKTTCRRITASSNYCSSDRSIYNDEQVPYYTAKDIEFAPNRAKDVLQNHVEETSCYQNIAEDCGSAATKPEVEEEHTIAYRADSSVSLHSVMQSNVPDPFTTPDKAPTHLNMPGGSSTRNYKYLSDKMQTAHHTRQ